LAEPKTTSLFGLDRILFFGLD